MPSARHALSGWHPEDVKAAIRKRGISLTELSLRHGYSECYLRATLTRPFLQGQTIISAFLGVPAHVIWPDRYDADGNPDLRRWSRYRRQRSKAAK